MVTSSDYQRFDSLRRIGAVYATPSCSSLSGALVQKYGLIDLVKSPDEEVDLLIIIGGDGLMLHSLHSYIIGSDTPVYGINCGAVGFLLNRYSGDDDLMERISKAVPARLPLLKMETVSIDGSQSSALAVNEVSLFRGTHQALHIGIKVDGQIRMEKLISDGIMLSTPAGSTAYNFSAGGSILPLSSDLLALTSINSFRPRRWRGALLPSDAVIELEVFDPTNRKAMAVADYTNSDDVVSVKIEKDPDTMITLLFDAGHDLNEKIIKEQFLF